MLCSDQQESSPQEVLISSLLSTQEQNRITRHKRHCKFELGKRETHLVWGKPMRNHCCLCFYLWPKTEKWWNTAERQQEEDWVAKSSSWAGAMCVQHHSCPTFTSDSSLSNCWLQPGLHGCQKLPQTTEGFRLQEKMTYSYIHTFK